MVAHELIPIKLTPQQLLLVYEALNPDTLPDSSNGSRRRMAREVRSKIAVVLPEEKEL